VYLSKALCTEALDIVYLPDQIKLISKRHRNTDDSVAPIKADNGETGAVLLFEILPTVNRRSHLSYCWSNQAAQIEELQRLNQQR